MDDIIWDTTVGTTAVGLNPEALKASGSFGS